MTRWIGREKVRKRFLALPKHARAFVDEALIQGADEIVAMQKRLVAVDDGDLRDSIMWRWTGATGGKPLTIEVSAGGPNAWWAQAVEFGTAPHKAGGMFAGAMHPGTAPQAFFYPSYRSLRKKVKSRIRRSLRKAVVASRNA